MILPWIEGMVYTFALFGAVGNVMIFVPAVIFLLVTEEWLELDRFKWRHVIITFPLLPGLVLAFIVALIVHSIAITVTEKTLDELLNQRIFKKGEK